jgi:hypothetical protein
MAYSKSYTLDFGPTGDNYPQAADKLEDNIDAIITYLNSLKSSFQSTVAPSSPDQGQLWTDSNDDPPTLKQYHGTAWVAVSSPIPLTPQNHLSGLTVTHATDTDHDIVIASGKARDDTDAVDMTLAAALIKRADATWVVGDTNGGMATGESLPTSGTIHLWLIKRSDTGVIDAMFNNHATTALAPTLPTNYDYKRRIASFRTDGSANIINRVQWGTGNLRKFMYNTPILDIDDDNPGTSAVTRALSVPVGNKVLAVFNAVSVQGNAASVPQPYFSDLASVDMAPSVSAAPLAQGGSDSIAFGPREVLTDTSGQIRSRVTASGTTSYLRMATLGYWEDL